MENIFDKSLHYLGRKNNDTFVINVGAMDGILFDEMYGYTNKYNFSGLYVEPIPYLFEKLQKNITSGLFENSAISDYDGTINMVTIDQDVIDQGLVHNCFYGMSAVYPPKNGLGSEFDRPTVEKYGKIVSVNCITWNTLLKKHNINKIDVIKIDAEGHDYQIFKQINILEHGLKVIRLEWINLNNEEKEKIVEVFDKNQFVYEFSGQDIVAVSRSFYNELTGKETVSNDTVSKITLVTGLWDLGRDYLSDGWNRGFESHYLNKLKDFLSIPENLIIFGDSKLKEFVQKNKKHDRIQFIERDLEWFKNNFFDKIQSIRNDPSWYNQKGWLKDSTQAKLEFYNPVVMQKMFLLNDAKIMDQFDSKYMFWLDAGITNTVHSGYFTHDKVLQKLPRFINKFSFVCFPYESDGEIHGFKFDEICKISGSLVNKVARGGFFGGPKDQISEAMSVYYGLVNDTLSRGFMGTEESVFSIMVYKYPQQFDYFEIESNGLLGKFFEDLKNSSLKVKNETNISNKNVNLDLNRTSVYVITFNSPKQFEKLINSFIAYDDDLIEKPKKYLLNNSTDRSTDKFYDELCEEYEFIQIKFPENLGICGGRQYIAEHFENSDSDFMFFFEDDMFFYSGQGDFCKNGFGRKISQIYSKSLEITKNEGFDFLKLNFTEFYGDNSTQWSWYNVPQDFRSHRWPQYNRLPVQGLDPNAPRTDFKNIKSYKGLPYATGEIYYSNWPQIVTKEGNKKMFLETTWSYPHEQTWMSYIYQETLKDRIRPGILLLTPTEHNRFDHYDGKLRKES